MATPVFYHNMPITRGLPLVSFFTLCVHVNVQCYHHYAPIGLHETDAACDWLLIKLHCTGCAKTTTNKFCTKFAISFDFAALRTPVRNERN
jgi:hypothetical protein